MSLEDFRTIALHLHKLKQIFKKKGSVSVSYQNTKEDCKINSLDRTLIVQNTLY